MPTGASGISLLWALIQLVFCSASSAFRMRPFIRGNTDRFVAFGDRPAPTMEEAASDRSLLPALVEVANTFAWTQGMVTAGGGGSIGFVRCPWSSGTTLLKTPRFFASTRSQVVTMARVSRRNSHQVIWRSVKRVRGNGDLRRPHPSRDRQSGRRDASDYRAR